MTLDGQSERNSVPDLTAALEQLWKRFLPEIEERVSILDAAARACAAGELPKEQREAAHAAAHKLAGTLGTFSLARGTELAREFEQICDGKDTCSGDQGGRLSTLAAEIRTIIANRS